MSRYLELPPKELDPEQRQVYDKVTATCETYFGPKFFYKNDDDSFDGPFAPMLYTPTMLKPWIELLSELAKFPEITPQARETAILAAGSVFQAKFALYDHKNLSVYKNILTQNQVDHIARGEKPTQDNLDDKVEVASDIAIALTTSRGPLDSALFEKAVKEFGKTGALVLINYVAFYAYTCILLNGVDAPVPNISVFSSRK